MHPASTNPSRGRTFYSLKNRRPVGGGLEVTRGYFQSIRPTFDKLLINIDIATGVTYRAGALIDMYLEFLALRPPVNISSSLGTALSDYNRLKAQRFSTGVSVLAKSPNGDERSYGIYKLTKQGADTLRFQRDGVSNTVASYFAQSNRPLRFPKVICIEVRYATVASIILLMICIDETRHVHSPRVLHCSAWAGGTLRGGSRHSTQGCRICHAITVATVVGNQG